MMPWLLSNVILAKMMSPGKLERYCCPPIEWIRDFVVPDEALMLFFTIY